MEMFQFRSKSIYFLILAVVCLIGSHRRPCCSHQASQETAMGINFFVEGGISGLRQHFYQKYPLAFQVKPISRMPLTKFQIGMPHLPQYRPKLPVLTHVDHLCIDMNQFVHIAARSSDYQLNDHFSKRFHRMIGDHIKRFQPKKSIVLAFDGTAPFAKLVTQRHRRLEHPEISLLTPGSHFMNTMENLTMSFIVKYVSQQRQQTDQQGWQRGFYGDRPMYQTNKFNRDRESNSALLPDSYEFQTSSSSTFHKSSHLVNADPTFFLSGPCQGGEGEVKLLQWIKDHLILSTTDTTLGMNHHRADRLTRNELTRMRDKRITFPQTHRQIEVESHKDTIVLCGMDSDLILEALTLTKDSDVYVYGLNGGDQHLCHVNKLWECFDLSGSQSSLSNRNLTVSDSFLNREILENRKLDMVFLFGLMGNDYLPKLKGIKWDDLMETYQLAMQQLPPDQAFIYNAKRKAFTFSGLNAFVSCLLSDSILVGSTYHSLVPSILDELYLVAQSSNMFVYFNTTSLQSNEPTKIATLLINNETIYAWPSPPSRFTHLEIKSILSMIAFEHHFCPDYFQSYLKRLNDAIDYVKIFPKTASLVQSTLKHTKALSEIESYRNDIIIQDLSKKNNSKSTSSIMAKVRRVQQFKKIGKMSDTQNYLRGMSWYLNMYRMGNCNDYSYSHHDFGPITAFHLKELLDNVKDECQSKGNLIILGEFFNRTRSESRAFSPEVACAVVAGAEEYIPDNLRGLWKCLQMDYHLDQNSFPDDTTNDSFGRLLTILDKYFGSRKPIFQQKPHAWTVFHSHRQRDDALNMMYKGTMKPFFMPMPANSSRSFPSNLFIKKLITKENLNGPNKRRY